MKTKIIYHCPQCKYKEEKAFCIVAHSNDECEGMTVYQKSFSAKLAYEKVRKMKVLPLSGFYDKIHIYPLFCFDKRDYDHIPEWKDGDL